MHEEVDPSKAETTHSLSVCMAMRRMEVMVPAMIPVLRATNR
jgi:hypothetical protein